MGIPLTQRRATVLVALFLIVTVFTTVVAPTSAHAVGTAAQEQTGNAQKIADIFDEHNRYRRQHGLSPLRLSPDIAVRVTQPFTNSMAKANNGTIWHNTPANIRQGGGNWAENVAGGFRGETASELVARWMNSAGHRTNILNSAYTTISIGFAEADTGDWNFATTNFYASPISPGTTFPTGAAWLATLSTSGTPSDAPDSSVNVYLTPGTHTVNGRRWRTTCEPYSQTRRCRTEIWATQVAYEGGGFSQSTGWVFNNLTYAPSPRALWAGNPLGGNAVAGGSVSWVSDGRKWRTECDTATTGRNGCRSYTTATVVQGIAGSYRLVETEIFNNMVLFG